MESRQQELAIVRAACRKTRETPEQHQARLKGDRLKSRKQRTLETPDD